jgi:hypothetical protein
MAPASGTRAGGVRSLPDGPKPAMQPTRDPGATLPDLVEALLNKGVFLNLDLIITVADIPLIGVNLRATIAGMETMLEYGMMQSWDARTRAWARDSVSRHVGLEQDEEIVAKVAGSYCHEGTPTVWLPGHIYLTTQRLVVHRQSPPEVLWQVRIGDIETLTLQEQTSRGGQSQPRLRLEKNDGGTGLLSTADPERLRTLILNTQTENDAGSPTAIAARSAASVPAREEPDTLLLQGELWYEEERSGSRTWRGGTGRYDSEEGFSWKAALDRRPAVRIQPAEILAVRAESGRTPVGESAVLVLESPQATVRLAGERIRQWALLLHGVSQGEDEETEADGDAQSR